MNTKFEPTPQQENDAECVIPRGLRRGRSIDDIVSELQSRGWPKEAAAEFVEKTRQEIVERQAKKALLKSKRNGRPLLITILCVGMFITTPIGLALASSEAARNVAVWYPYLLGFSFTAGLVCAVGFWKMRRWAAWAYLGMFAACQLILLVSGLWQLGSAVFPAVFTTIVFCYYRRMH